MNSADYGIWEGSSTSKCMGKTSYNEVESMIFFMISLDKIVVVSLKSKGCGMVESSSYFDGMRYKFEVYPFAFLQW